MAQATRDSDNTIVAGFAPLVDYAGLSSGAAIAVDESEVLTFSEAQPQWIETAREYHQAREAIILLQQIASIVPGIGETKIETPDPRFSEKLLWLLEHCPEQARDLPLTIYHRGRHRNITVENVLWDGEKTECIVLTEYGRKKIPYTKIFGNKNDFPKIDEKQVKAAFISQINNVVNQEGNTLGGYIEQYKREISNHQRRIAKYKSDMAVYQEKLAKFVQVNVDEAYVTSQLQEIKKHVKVDRVGINTKANVAVITKMLQVRDPRKERLIKKRPLIDLGRFYIAIGIDRMRVTNMDYLLLRSEGDTSFSHPNVSHGNVCWGDHENTMHELIRGQKYFEIVDFLIEFLTTYPHQGGNPYIGYNEWLDLRKQITPSVEREFLWMMEV